MVTFGFLLVGALSTAGNLTTGGVSALRGLRDNPDMLRIHTRLGQCPPKGRSGSTGSRSLPGCLPHIVA